MAKINFNDLGTDKLQEILDENDQRIRKLMEEEQEVIKQQADKINELVSKLRPVIDNLASKGFYFFHPKIKYRSSRGPVIGYSNDTNKLYILHSGDYRVREIDLYEREEIKVIQLMSFLEICDFQTAVEGLLHVLEHHQITIDGFEKTINDRKRAITRYDASFINP